MPRHTSSSTKLQVILRLINKTQTRFLFNKTTVTYTLHVGPNPKSRPMKPFGLTKQLFFTNRRPICYI